MATLTHDHRTRTDWRAGARIVAAITAKDIAEGLKNKSIATAVGGCLLFIVMFRGLPLLTSDNAAPVVRVYDAGQSSLLPALEDSPAIDTYVYASEAQLERGLAAAEIPEMGLVIPADYDPVRASGGVPELQGLVLHWVSPAEAARLQQAVEGVLAELAGGPVRVRLEGGRLYLPPEAHGLSSTASFSALMVLLILGLSFLPHLMFEEKRSRTLEALLVSPASVEQVTLAKALTGLFYILACLALVFAIYHRLITQWWLAALAAVSGALFAVALGLLLGLLFSSPVQLFIAIQPLIVLFGGSLIVSDLAQGEMVPGWIGLLAKAMPTVGMDRMLRVSFSNQAAIGLWGPAWLAVAAWATLLLALVAWRLSRADR
jgi:ABC-2 type transport system permease protein